MTPRIQIVGRLPVDLSRRVRAAANAAGVSLNAFLIAALTRAVAESARPSRGKTGA
jgi:predicted HicB family RNase H-like nuclease